MNTLFEVCMKNIMLMILASTATAAIAQTVDGLAARNLYAYSCDGDSLQAEKALSFKKVSQNVVEAIYSTENANQQNFKLCFDKAACKIPQDAPDREDVPTPREYHAKWLSPDKIQLSGWTVGEPRHGKYRVFWRESVLDLKVNVLEGNSVIPWLGDLRAEVSIECVGAVSNINDHAPIFTYKYSYSLGRSGNPKTCISNFEVTERLSSTGEPQSVAFENVQVGRVNGSYYPSRDFSIFKRDVANYNFSAFPDEGHTIRKRRRQHTPLVLTSSAPGESGGATTCKIVE